MNYPISLTGEPNFVLIGVSGIFGLLVIIMIYYIFISKNSRGSGGSTRNSSNLQASQLLGSSNLPNPNSVRKSS